MRPKPEHADNEPITESDVSRYYSDFIVLCSDRNEDAFAVYKSKYIPLPDKADILNGMSLRVLTQRLDDGENKTQSDNMETPVEESSHRLSTLGYIALTMGQSYKKWCFDFVQLRYGNNHKD